MSTKQMAEKFVREQIAIMKKHGSAPRLDAERRREFVASVQRTFETLQGSTSPARDRAQRA